MTDLSEVGVVGPEGHAPPIDRHRVLGDGHTTALLRPDGEIDWWCAPLPHDDPLLWSLLDPDGGAARFRAAVPAGGEDGHPGPVAAPVLEAQLELGSGGRILVCDALLPTSVGGSALVRTVRAVGEPVVAEHALRLGAFDATRSTWEGGAVRIGELHWRLHAGGAPLRVERGELITELALQPGDRPLVLIVTADPTFDVRTDDVLARVADRGGDRQHLVVRGSTPYAPTVDRRLADGLDVLRACTHAPTGALLAAPTTSLPEVPGADRQWDYRYTWLRDGSLGAAVAAVAGDSEVADGYLGFLECLGPEKVLQSPLWSVDATPVPVEREIAGVEGWGGSQPVRVGNAASTQVQYDAMGFLVEAISIVSRETGELTPGRWALVHAVAEQVTARPPGRTAGIWELRDPRHLVAADIGVWMALDHALRLAAHHRLPALPSWSTAREAARRRVRGAVLPDGLLPQTYPGADGPPRPDASALVAVICGLIEPDDPAASAIIDRCVEELGTGPFLHRYPPGDDDGFSGSEGTFTPASFWVVAALASVGRRDEAEARYTALDDALPRLLSEEWDPVAGRSLGNTPLVWSHIESIRALYAIDGSIVG